MLPSIGYKEIVCKSSRKYKQVWVGALADQDMVN